MTKAEKSALIEKLTTEFKASSTAARKNSPAGWSRYSPQTQEPLSSDQGSKAVLYHVRLRGAAGSVDFNVARGDAVSVTRACAAGSVNPSIAPQATAQR